MLKECLFLMTAVAMLSTFLGMAEAQSVRACPEDQQIWAKRDCGSIPKYCQDPCFGPTEEYNRYDACLARNREADRHNLEIRTCTQSSNQPESKETAPPRKADNPSSSLNDDLSKRLQKAKAKSEGYEEKNHKTLRDFEQKRSEQIQTPKLPVDDLKADREQVKKLKDSVEQNTAKIKREIGRAYTITCTGAPKFTERPDDYESLRNCVYKHCPLIRNATDAWACFNRFKDNSSISSRESVLCQHKIERFALDMPGGSYSGRGYCTTEVH